MSALKDFGRGCGSHIPLIFDFGSEMTGSIEKYLVFRVPVLPTSGTNADLSYVHESKEYLELSDQVCSAEDDPIGNHRHGIIPERVFNIMAEGGMRPSKTNIKQGVIGVYATVPTDWQTPCRMPWPLHYSTMESSTSLSRSYVLQKRASSTTPSWERITFWIQAEQDSPH